MPPLHGHDAAHELVSGIVRILTPGGETAGTGFYVGPGDRIVTCAHVIAGWRGGDGKFTDVRVSISGHGVMAARLEAYSPVNEKDIAVLRLAEHPDDRIRPLRLGRSAGTEGHPVRTFGFPALGEIEGLWGQGTIQGALQEPRGLLQIRSPEITRGFSGAPVWDDRRQSVVGIVAQIANPDAHLRMTETAVAIPVEWLQALCPDLAPADIPPYLGLRPFTEQEAPLFFGREHLLEKLLSRLRQQQRFLAVLGPSGSGKSSVIRAGLLAHLRHEAAARGETIRVIVTRPAEDPYRQLAAAGFPDVRGTNRLADGVEKLLKQRAKPRRVILLIDQFEELFLLVQPARRRQFLADLHQLLSGHLPVLVVIGMRSDFYGPLTNETRELNEWLEAGSVNIPPTLALDEVRRMVEGPADLLGYRFETGLVDSLLHEVNGLADHAGDAVAATLLPLLAFALEQLWANRSDGLLTHEAYRHAGGITGGLSQWATAAYRGLTAREQPLARQLFTSLVEVGDPGRRIADARRRVRFDDCTDVSGQFPAVIHQLAAARLISIDADPATGDQVIELVHEALLREWDLLRRWVDENRNFLKWRQRTEEQARLWVESNPGNPRGRDPELLLGVRSLAEAMVWTRHGQELSPLLREYRRASRKRIFLVQGARWASLVAFVILLGWGISRAVAGSTQAHHTRARDLAEKSAYLLRNVGDSATLSALLAVESLREEYTSEGVGAINASLPLVRRPVAELRVPGRATGLMFSPDGTQLAAAGPDRRTLEIEDYVVLWSTRSWQEVSLRTQVPFLEAVGVPALQADGSLMVPMSPPVLPFIWKDMTDSPLAKSQDPWERARLQEWAQIKGDESPAAQAFLEAIRRYWLPEPALSRTVPAAVTPDLRWLALGLPTGQVRIWDSAAGREYSWKLPGEFDRIYLSPTGGWLATVVHDRPVRIWDVATGSELARLNRIGSSGAIAISQDGNQVATQDDDEVVRVWNMASPMAEAVPVQEEARRTFGPAHLGGLLGLSVPAGPPAGGVTVGYGQSLSAVTDGTRLAVALSQDGSLLALGHLNEIRVFRTADETELVRMERPNVLRADASPEFGLMAFGWGGKVLVTASPGGIMDVWNLPAGEHLGTLRHETRVMSIAASPDGAWLASAGDDGLIRIWDLSKQKVVATLSHEGAFNNLRFSTDSMWLTGQTENHAWKKWVWHPQDLIAYACKQIPRNLTAQEWKEHMGNRAYRKTCSDLP